jgi:hypothetical protein
MRTLVLAKGKVSFERVFRLPVGQRAWARANRDLWLRRAAAYIDAANQTERARKLSLEIRRFVRFRWPAWRRRANPPPNAAKVDAALFFACQASGGDDRIELGWRQLVTILDGETCN